MKINVVNEKSPKRNTQYIEEKQPMTSYAKPASNPIRPTTVGKPLKQGSTDELESGQKSKEFRSIRTGVKFDLIIQRTSGGEIDEKGKCSYSMS